MPAIGRRASCECLVWLRGGSSDNCWYCTPEAGDLGRNFPSRALAQEVVEVDTGQTPWTEVCIVQFLSVARHHCLRAIKAAPHVPLASYRLAQGVKSSLWYQSFASPLACILFKEALKNDCF